MSSGLLAEVQYGIPEFGLFIPPGFQRFALTDDFFAAREGVIEEMAADDDEAKAVKKRVKLQFDSLRQMLREMQAFGMIATHENAGAIFPMTLVFASQPIPAGQRAVHVLRQFREQQQAEFPEDENRMLRWEEAGNSRIDGTNVRMRYVFYLVPVPEARGGKLLLMVNQMVVGIGDEVLPPEEVAMMLELGDTVVGTFRWMKKQPIEFTMADLDAGVVPGDPEPAPEATGTGAEAAEAEDGLQAEESVQSDAVATTGEADHENVAEAPFDGGDHVSNRQGGTQADPA